MKITTKQLLNFLPLDPQTKAVVLINSDKYKDDQKRALERFCWKLFYTLIDYETEHEFEKTLEKAKEGNIKLDSNLYQQIENRTYKKFLRDIMQQIEYESISEVRSGLQQLIANKIQTELPKSN